MIERYRVDEIEEIFSSSKKYQRWLEVELAIFEFFVTQGEVSSQSLTWLKENLKVDEKLIAKKEKELHHDVFAFLASFEKADKNHTKFFHFGITSTDIVDTANSIALKEVNQILKSKLSKLLTVLKERAYEFKDLPAVGRTHGKHAEITSFGLLFALFYDSLNRRIKSFERVCEEIEVAKISGATGSSAHFSVELQKFVAQKFGLTSAAISTQILSRDRHLAYFLELQIFGAIIENFATQFRLLALEEVAEIAEGFSKTQRGSSAMPHKKNPVSLENICGMTRMLQGFGNIAHSNTTLWHQRDISHSSNERILFSDATQTLAYVVDKFVNVLENMVVNLDKIQDNINLSLPKLASQCLVLKLTKLTSLTRLEAYELIRKIFSKEMPTKEKLIQEISYNLPLQKILLCFEPSYYLKNVDEIFKEVFGS